MAAGNWTLFNKAVKKTHDGTITLSSTILRCKIYKAQVSASLAAASNYSLLSELGLTNAAANMSDYTLSSRAITAQNGSLTHQLTGANLVITASGGDATSLKYAVVYSSLAADSGHLLMWCKLSDSAFSVTSGNTLTINVPAGGYLEIY